MKMISVSISGLRKYSNLPIKVIFIENRKDDPSQFLSFCDQFNVEIIRKEWFNCDDELNYFPINKAHLADIQGDRILFIDADTFVFGDVECIFDQYNGFDVVACENKWGKELWKPHYLKKVRPINSGVMLWDGDWLRLSAALMPDICVGLKNKQYPLSEYLYNVDHKCWNREEFAYSVFLDQQETLQVGYFDRQHVHNLLWEQEIKDAKKSIIFHSYTSQWRKVYEEVYGSPRKLVSKKFFPVR